MRVSGLSRMPQGACWARQGAFSRAEVASDTLRSLVGHPGGFLESLTRPEGETRRAGVESGRP